jgi:hypothetical protein
MKMKMRTVFLFFLIVLLVAFAAYNKGRNDVWIAEFKTYDANLIQLQYFQTNLPPDVKEFMKGRYYYLANKIPQAWLGSPYDYGQVSTNVAHLNVGKGPTTAQHEYELFKEKNVIFSEPKTQP